MKINDIEIMPIASESMGVRSMCTFIKTPDISILLDPSAALSKRFGLEPHPMEYERLSRALDRIFVHARQADILSISHYHYDHVRPGFTNFQYNFSSLEELERMFEGKMVFAKDNRENINSSQRRRGHLFEKDVSAVVESIKWSDGETFQFGETTIVHSPALPHGPDGTRLGFVVATTIIHNRTRVMFAPDVQGPVSERSLRYIESQHPRLLIIGGPPIYIGRFNDDMRTRARLSLETLVKQTSVVVVDHHLLRTGDWNKYLGPVREQCAMNKHKLITMAELGGFPIECLEAKRKKLFREQPPSPEFMHWMQSTDEYKKTHRPPVR